MTQDQIEAWADRQFLDCSKAELIAIINAAGAPVPHGKTGEEKLRQQCCELLGRPFSPRAEASAPPVTNDPPPKTSLLASSRNWFKHMPQLRSRAGWAGRRRRVKLHVSQRLPEGTMAILSVDGWDIGVQPTFEVNIPYPHYEALKNTTVTSGSRSEVFNPTTGQREFKTRMIHTPTYPFEDMGDDPSTAHLATSAIAWLQTEARKRNFLYGEDKDTLVSIYNYLTDNALGRQKARDMQREHILEDVLVKLSLYDEALEAERSQEAAA